MKFEPKTPSLLIGALLIVMLIVVVGTMFLTGAWQLRSITGNTHTYTAFGQNWSATPVQNWGTTPTTCRLGGSKNSYAAYVTTEENTSSLLHFTATTPNMLGRQCTFTTGFEVTLDTVDLRAYSAGRVHRSLGMSMDAEESATFTASVNDLLIDTTPRKIASFHRNYGDITWTNDGNTILLKSDEYPSGKLLSIGNTPIRLRLSDMIGEPLSDPSSGGSVDLVITGLDLVPMPAGITKPPTTIPVPVLTQPIVTIPAGSGAGSAGPVTAPSTTTSTTAPTFPPFSWRDYIIGNISGAWHEFLGWFGVNT